MVSAGLFLGSFQAWAQMEDFGVQSSVILEAEGHACMGGINPGRRPGSWPWLRQKERLLRWPSCI